MKKVDASHAEFTECANKLRAASMGVQANAWADMQEGAHKLEKAAALLDVFANSIRTLRDENDKLRAELEAAKEDMHLFAQCVTCAHTYDGGMRCRVPLKERKHKGEYCTTWQWRGVPANYGEQEAPEPMGGGEG